MALKKEIFSLLRIPKFHSTSKSSSKPPPTIFKLKESYFYPKLIDLQNNLLKTGPSMMTEASSFTPGRALSCLTVGTSDLLSPTSPWQVPSAMSWPPLTTPGLLQLDQKLTDKPAHPQVCILVLLEPLVTSQYPAPQALDREHLCGESPSPHRAAWESRRKMASRGSCKPFSAGLAFKAGTAAFPIWCKMLFSFPRASMEFVDMMGVER